MCPYTLPILALDEFTSLRGNVLPESHPGVPLDLPSSLKRLYVIYTRTRDTGEEKDSLRHRSPLITPGRRLTRHPNYVPESLNLL